MRINITYFADLIDGALLTQNKNLALAPLREIIQDSKKKDEDLWIVNGLGNILSLDLEERAKALLSAGSSEGGLREFGETGDAPSPGSDEESPRGQLREEAEEHAYAIYQKLQWEVPKLFGLLPSIVVPGGRDVIPSCKNSFMDEFFFLFSAQSVEDPGSSSDLQNESIVVYGQGAETADHPELADLLSLQRQEDGKTFSERSPHLIVSGQVPHEEGAVSSIAQTTLESYLGTVRGTLVFVRDPERPFTDRSVAMVNGNLVIRGTSFGLSSRFEHPGTFIVGEYQNNPVGTIAFDAYVLQAIPFIEDKKVKEWLLRFCYRIQWSGGDTLVVKKDRDFAGKDVYADLK